MEKARSSESTPSAHPRTHFNFPNHPLSCITLTFKILFPPTLHTLSQKRTVPILRTASLAWHKTIQPLVRNRSASWALPPPEKKKKACSVIQESNKTMVTCLVFFPGSQEELYSGPCEMAEQWFCVDYAKHGMAGWKKNQGKGCEECMPDQQSGTHPFSESRGDMKEW